MGSVLNSVTFEKAGKPAVAIVGDEFMPHAEAFMKAWGMPSLKVISVPYPLGSVEEAIRKAEIAFPQIVSSILALP